MGLRMKELPENARPFEKCELFGFDALSDAELLAMILRCGTKSMNSVDVSRRVLEEAGGSLAGLPFLSGAVLKKLPGIGRTKALQIQAVAVLSSRMTRSVRRTGTDLSSPEAVFSCYGEEMRAEPQEIVKALFLTSKMKLIREFTVSKGSVKESMVPVREIFLEALRYEAVHVILLHNHPSGDPTPSKSDRQVTERVVAAGKTVGVELVDHVVIGDRSYFSMRQEGWIK